MTTKYYAMYEPCKCCGLSRDPVFLVMTSMLGKGGYKLYHHVERFKKQVDITDFISNGDFDFIEDEYSDKISRDDGLKLVRDAVYLEITENEPL